VTFKLIHLSKIKPTLPLIFRLSLTGALLTWVYLSIGADVLLQTWKIINIKFLFLAVLIQTFGYVFGSLRWWLLLKRAGIRIPFFEALSLCYLGLFFNQFLPAGIGGDAVRIYKLYQRGYAGPASAASTIIDRLVGLVALLILTWLAVLLSEVKILPTTAEFMIGILMVASLTGGLLFFFLPSSRIVTALVSRFNLQSIAGRFLKTLRACRTGSFRLLIAALLLSLILQSIMILVYAILARALDIDISLPILFFAIPIVFVATILPFSLGGLGVRESALIAVLGLMGVEMEQSGQLALAYLITLWLSIIPGGWSLVFGTRDWTFGRKAAIK